MSYYVYIMKSESTGSLYIGSTPNINKILSEHNEGKNISTMSKRPWSLIYKEEQPTFSEAASREKYYKSGEGMTELKSKGIL